MKSLFELLEPFKRAVTIDQFLSLEIRRNIRRGLILCTAAVFSTSIFNERSLFDGLTLILFGFLILVLMFEAFYRSSKFAKVQAEYAVAVAFFGSDTVDLTHHFVSSFPGKVLLFRLGIGTTDLSQFIDGSRIIIGESDFAVEAQPITFVSYAQALYTADSYLKSFITAHGITEAEFEGAARWIGRESELLLARERWWSKEHLSSVPSLGTSLDYGTNFEVSRYSLSLEAGKDLLGLDLDTNYRMREVAELENILVRSMEANALIIDDDESVAEGILDRLLKKIRWGTAQSELEHMHILKLDWNLLTTEHSTKDTLEVELLKIFADAASSGNTIVYIPNLPAFITTSKQIGVAVPTLLNDYLHSRTNRIIAHATKSDFHYLIESNPILTRTFERILPDDAGVDASLPPLIEAARSFEGSHKIRYSYPALLAIAESADRYIPYGEMPAKAIDLLVEITPWAEKQGTVLLRKQDVLSFVTFKTGIATGEVSKGEEDKLSHLEDILHQRIVGQERAVSAIAQAMRRARSGLSNPKKPFASFLFLGPTGVGKTETSKALAQSFFGDAQKMIRFDMSQYNEPDALPALVGSSSAGNPGLLSSKVRDNPYGVLLLDEFEKASPDVRDLFLQVLDEGEYTDALGGKVNCRNLIIIATSNAGSDIIWKLVEDGKDLQKEKQRIIDTLIANHTYKPELLNRFDDIVLFHPLSANQFSEVAQKMFADLATRIQKDKQITISIAPELLNQIVAQNHDTEFGARSVGRLIQDKIEDILARKIIAGSLKSGDTLEIKAEDVV